MTEVLLCVVSMLFVLPVCAYMVMKFGTAGFLRAKRREQETTNKKGDYAKTE